MRTGQAGVASDEGRAEPFGQRHIHGVVGCHGTTKLPGARQQIGVCVSLNCQLMKVVHRDCRALGRNFTREREPPADGRGATGADVIWPGALRTEDPVPRRHHAHLDGAAGPDGPPCRAGAASSDAFDEISRRVRAKRVFGVEINTCARCGGKRKVIASIEEPEVIAKILAQLEKTAPDHDQPELPLEARAPPTQARLI